MSARRGVRVAVVGPAGDETADLARLAIRWAELAPDADAALAARLLARHAQFFSIGTNDLIQYTLAIDRVDDEVNYLYDPLHPAVLQLIRLAIDAGRGNRIPVAMCGEMAGDARFTRLLLGLGLTEFSMHPSSLLEVKRIIIESNIERLRTQADELLRSASQDEMRERVAALLEA